MSTYVRCPIMPGAFIPIILTYHLCLVGFRRISSVFFVRNVYRSTPILIVVQAAALSVRDNLIVSRISAIGSPCLSGNSRNLP